MFEHLNYILTQGSGATDLRLLPQYISKCYSERIIKTSRH